ncbi:MAG: type II toxin-antitoxin system VapC family toxin [Sediminibacterium sp.]|jgi:predicted nucleic acid-binding protein
MAYKIYFDVNALLDLTLLRNNHNDIETVIKEVEKGTLRGFVCGATIHTISYFLIKKYNIDKTKQILLNLLSFISIVDLPKEDIQKALFMNLKDIEDAIQVQTALTYKMDYFLTSDKQLIKASSETMPILNASSFLKRISEN